MAVSNTMRLRITFEKNEAMRYTGHLDLHRTWERAFRRAGLAIAYSQGFHPKPRLNLACALPLGFTSHCEIIDAWLEETLPVEKVKKDLESSFPPGIALQDIIQVEESEPSLQSQVVSSRYTISFLDPIPDLAQRLERLEKAQTLPRVRRNKPYDLRPLIESISHQRNESDEGMTIQVQLAARESATGRPEELVAEMGIDPFLARYHRTGLLLDKPDVID